MQNSSSYYSHLDIRTGTKIKIKIQFAGKPSTLSVKRKMDENLQKKHSNNGQKNILLSVMSFVYLHVK